MGYIRKKLIVFTLILISTVAIFTGCSKDKYKGLKLDVDNTDIEVVLSDNVEENVFSITASVSKMPKGYDGAVSFSMPVNNFIEVVDDKPQVKNGVSTAYFKATRQGGPITITVMTKEGNLSKEVNVRVTRPITSLSFNQETIPVLKGEKTDISKFITFNPSGTNQNGIQLELSNGDQPNELIKVVTEGQYLTVPNDVTLSSFQIRAKSTVNPELTTSFVNAKVVTIVPKNNITLMYDNRTPDMSDDDIALDKNSDGEFDLIMATNAADSYSKTIYFNFNNNASENNNYKVTVKGLKDDGTIVDDDNVINNIVQIDKTLNKLNSFDIKAIGKGKTQITFIIERADFPGYEPFRQTITLNIRCESFPTEINITNGTDNKALEEIRLYANYNENSGVFGTRFRINVVNETGIMNNQDVVLSLSSGANNIQLYDRFHNAIPFNTPIDSNMDYYLAHTFATPPTTTIKLTVTSVSYSKVYKEIPINIDTKTLELSTTEPSLALDVTKKDTSRPLKIDGIQQSAFGTLKVELVKDGDVDASKLLTYTQSSTAINLSPLGDIGVCTVKVTAENGSELVFTVTLFESLNTENSRVKIAGVELQGSEEKNGQIPSITVRNGLNIPVTFIINNKVYNDLDKTGLEHIISTTDSRVVKVPNYRSIETQNIAGKSTIEVMITGYNEFGEKNKTLYFLVEINVTIPLSDFSSNNPEVTTLYDRSGLISTQEENAYGKYTIKLYSSPINASYTKMKWKCVDNYGETLEPQTSISNWDGEFYEYDKSQGATVIQYSNSEYTIIVRIIDLASAEVECYFNSATNKDYLTFRLIAKVEQSFVNEDGVQISAPKETSVRFVVNKVVKVSDYIFTNIASISNEDVLQCITCGHKVERSSITEDADFSQPQVELTCPVCGKKTTHKVIRSGYSLIEYDERDLNYANGQYNNPEAQVKVVDFDILPKNALNKNLAAECSDPALTVNVDNTNRKINITINSQLMTDNMAIIKVYALDNVDNMGSYTSYKEIKIKVNDGKTKATAYNIYTVEDLKRINSSLNSYYVLRNNIMLTDDWMPIGYVNGIVNKFTGYLSGHYEEVENDTLIFAADYSINNLRIHNDNIDYFGLFAYLGENAVIERLTINNFKIKANITRQVNIFAGALAGYSEGTIENVVVNDGSGIANITGDYYVNSSKEEPNNGIFITGSTDTSENSFYFVGGVVGFLNNTSRYSLNTSMKINGEGRNTTNGLDYKAIDTTSNYRITSNEIQKLQERAVRSYRYCGENNSDAASQMFDVTSTALINVSVKSNNIAYIGGMVGFNNRAYIHNANDNETLTNSTHVITSINSSLPEEQKINSMYASFGGVVGFNAGIVAGVTAKADIIGDYKDRQEEYYMSNVGGIVGYNTGVVKDNVSFPLLRGFTNIGGIVGKSETGIVHIVSNPDDTTKYHFVNGIGNSTSEENAKFQENFVDFNKNFKIYLENFETLSLTKSEIRQLLNSLSIDTNNVDDYVNAIGEHDDNATFAIIRITYHDLILGKSSLVSTEYDFRLGNDKGNGFTQSYYSQSITSGLAKSLSLVGTNLILNNQVQMLKLNTIDDEYKTAIIGFNGVGGVIGTYNGLVVVDSDLRIKNIYYNSDNPSSSTNVFTSVYNYISYSPISYNSVYSYNNDPITPYNVSGYGTGYYGDIIVSDAHTKSLTNDNRNFAGGIVGILNSGVVTDAQAFVDIQGHLAGLGGVVGQTKGIVQINNTSFIGTLYNNDIDKVENKATPATGGIVGDALSASNTFALIGDYISGASAKTIYSYAASQLSAMYPTAYYGDIDISLDAQKENVSQFKFINRYYNNITNSYFMAMSKYGYITTKQIPTKPDSSDTTKSSYDTTSKDNYALASGYVGEGEKQVEIKYYDRLGESKVTETVSVDMIKVNQVATAITNESDKQNQAIDLKSQISYSFNSTENNIDSILSAYIVTSGNDKNGDGLIDETDGNKLTYIQRENQLETDNRHWYINSEVNNGLPVLFGIPRVVRLNNDDYSYRVNLLVNFPPKQINIEHIKDGVRTFIASLNDNEQNKLYSIISYYELADENYVATENGQSINFGSDTKVRLLPDDEVKLINDIKSKNRYNLSDILKVSTVPSFINSNSVKITSSNTNVLSIEMNYDNTYSFVARGAGNSTLTISSAYDSDLTHVVPINVINTINKIGLTYASSGVNTTITNNKEIIIPKSTLEYPSNVAIKSNVYGNYEYKGNNVTKTFSLESNMDGGVRYYFARLDSSNNPIVKFAKDSVSNYDFISKSTAITVNDKIRKEETIGDNVVYYFDVPSTMEAKFASTETFKNVSFVAVPYVNVYDGNRLIGTSTIVDVTSNDFVLRNYRNMVSVFNVTFSDVNWALNSSVSSLTINPSTEMSFKIDIRTEKSFEELYLTYYDSDNIERTIPVSKAFGDNNKDKKILIGDIALRCTNIPKQTVNGYLSYYFDIYIDYDSKSNISQSYVKNLTFFVAKFNTSDSIIVSENGYVTNDLTDYMDNNLKAVIPVAVNPQPVNDIVLKHYPNSEVSVSYDDNNNKITNVNLNEIAYDNIIPGHVGILKAYISPEYAAYDRLEISSSVDANTVVQLEQMLANARETDYGIIYNGTYQTLLTDIIRIDNGIVLQKKSYINQNKETKYNGYIYIRTLINSFVTEANSFTLTVRAYKDGVVDPVKVKSIKLDVQSPPSLSITIDGETRGVVARGTEHEITVQTNNFDGVVNFDESYMYYYGSNDQEIRVGAYKTDFEVIYRNNKYYLYTNLNTSTKYKIALIGKVSKKINGETIIFTSNVDVRITDFLIEEITVDNVFDGYMMGIFNQPYKLIVRVNKAKYNSEIAESVKLKIAQIEAQFSKATYKDTNNGQVLASPYIWRTVDTSVIDGDSRYAKIPDANESNSDKIIANSFTIGARNDGDFGETVYTVQNTKFGSNDRLAAVVKFAYGSQDPKDKKGEVQLIPITSDSTIDTTDSSYYIIKEEICEFTFNFHRERDEDAPDPISTVEELINMEDGVDYILVNDLTLKDWTPLRSDLKINSLDGNGYVLKLESFNLDSYDESADLIEEANIGIFSRINAGTTIKNLIIEIAPTSDHIASESASYDSKYVDLYVDARAYKNVTFGILAAENAGLITNVQVTYNATELINQRVQLTGETLPTSTKTNYYSSRDLSVVRIETTTTIETQTHYMAGLVAKNLDEGDSIGTITNSSIDDISISGVGYVSGFVVENAGKISSSYFKGGNIINRVAENYNESATSGFVIYNNSTNSAIQYSYVQGRVGEGNNPEGQINSSNFPDKTGLEKDIKSSFAGYNYIHSNDPKNKPNDNVVSLRAMNAVISTKTKASAFVFENDAVVSNSYANIMVNGVDSSGFVFRNKSKGTISSCYSLSSVKTNDYSSSPFTGVSEQSTYNNDNPTGYSDTHYLKIGSAVEDSDLERQYPDNFLDTDEPATAIGSTQLFEYNTFQSYAFNTDFEKNSVDKVTRAVWFMPSLNLSTDLAKKLKHSSYIAKRPELVAANMKTISVRVWTGTSQSEKNQYEYKSSPIGSDISNPKLIKSAEEFNKYFNQEMTVDVKNKSYAVRLISDIAFNSTDLTATTYTTQYSGDLDGNGMTINELRVVCDTDFESDDAQEEINYLGLFGQIVTEPIDTMTSRRGVVRNLNLVVDDVRGSKVKYVGALAGSIENADVFNINITGKSDSAFIQGQNVVGGLAGLVIGDSQIVNITNTVNVQSAYFSSSNIFSSKNPVANKGTFNIYDRAIPVLELGQTKKDQEPVKDDGIANTNVRVVSYAGGVIGILDVDSGSNSQSKQSLFNANARKLKVHGNIRIDGEIVGGVVGLNGYTSTISDATFIIDEDVTPKLRGTRISGGIVGENRGTLQRSYIAHTKTIQDKIDAEYKKGVSVSTANPIIYSSELNYNDLFARNANYIGGVIGFNNAGTVSDSYSRINVINLNSMYAGGFTGLDISGSYESIYVTSSVKGYYSAGGLIGLATKTASESVNDPTDSGMSSTRFAMGKMNDYLFFNTSTELTDSNGSQVDLKYSESKSSIPSSNLYNIGATSRGVLTNSIISLRKVVAINIWRKEDTNIVRKNSSQSSIGDNSYIGGFIGTLLYYVKDSSALTVGGIISAAENYYPQYQYTTNKYQSGEEITNVMSEVGLVVAGLTGDPKDGYSGNDDSSKAQFADDRRLNNNSFKNAGDFGYDEQKFETASAGSKKFTYKYNRYSRRQNISSARTYKELITSLTIIDEEENAIIKSNTYGIYKSGVIDRKNDNITVPLNYESWTTNRWTGIRRETAADNATVFPYLEAKPEKTVIEVDTVEKLKLMSDFRNAEFVLMNDIDLNDEEWTPIGSVASPFRGSLYSSKDANGVYNNFKIKNLKISQVGNEVYYGLLGYTSDASFHHFGLEKVDINVSSSNLNKENDIYNNPLFIGSLVGYSDAGTKIENVNVSNVTITSKTAGAIGGLIGYSGNGSINTCTINGLQINVQGIGDISKAGDNIDKTLAYGGLAGMITASASSKYIIANSKLSRGKVGNSEIINTIPIINIDIDKGGILQQYLNNISNKSFDVGGLAGRINDSTSMANNISSNEVTIKLNVELDFANDINSIINNINIGSLAGYANKIRLTNDGGNINKLINSDEKEEKDVVVINNYKGTFNYGGAIGKLVGETLSDDAINKQVSALYAFGKIVDITINGDSDNLINNIGGAIGYVENCTLSNIYVGSSKITYNAKIINGTNNIGGAIGNVNNCQTINRVYVDGNYTINHNSETINSVYDNIGGAFGKVFMAQNVNDAYEINQVVSSVNITTNIDITGNPKPTEYVVGGLIGKLYNGIVSESVATGNIAGTCTGSKINYVGGLVGNIDLNQTLNGVKNNIVKVIKSYSTTDIDLGKIFSTGSSNFAGLIVGNITFNKDNINSKVELSNNYSIGKFLYSVENKLAYADRENKGGFIGGFTTDLPLAYISNVKNLLFYNNIYNKDFVPYGNNYGDGYSTEELLFSGENIPFKSLKFNNEFINKEVWTIINQYSYPQLTWLNKTEESIAGINIAHADGIAINLQKLGTKVNPQILDSNITNINTNITNETYIVDSTKSISGIKLTNAQIYINPNKSDLISALSIDSIDSHSLLYGLTYNNTGNYLINNNSGMVINTSINSKLININKGIVYQTTIKNPGASTEFYIVNENIQTGIIDSMSINQQNITAKSKLVSDNKGYMFRSLSKDSNVSLSSDSDNGGNNYISSYKVVSDGNNTTYTYYDGSAISYEVIRDANGSIKCNDKVVVKNGKFDLGSLTSKNNSYTANPLSHDGFDMINDWVVINSTEEKLNYSIPMLRYELADNNDSYRTNYYGDISSDYIWANKTSQNEITELAGIVKNNNKIYIVNDKNNAEDNKNSTISMSDLIKMTNIGYIENNAIDYQLATGSEKYNNSSKYFNFNYSETTDTDSRISKVSTYKYNFGVRTHYNRMVVNSEGKEFWLAEDIKLNGKLWTPVGVGYESFGIELPESNKNDEISYTSSSVHGIEYPFRGSIQGTGKTISGATVVESNRNVGIFGTVKSTSFAKNLFIKDSNFISVSENGFAVAGSIAGRAIVGSTNQAQSQLTYSVVEYIGTENADVYASNRASGLVGDLIGIKTINDKNNEKIVIRYAYVNSNVYSLDKDNSSANAFIHIGNISSNITSQNTTDITQMYIAGNIGTYSYNNGYVYTRAESSDSSKTNLIGGFVTEIPEVSRTLYAVNYRDINSMGRYFNNKITSEYLQNHDLDYFTWGTRIKGTNNDYPTLKNALQYWVNDTKELAAEGNVFKVTTPQELAYIATLVNNNDSSIQNKTVVLMNDIDLGGKLWTPIGYSSTNNFSGTFNFNGKTISNITVTGAYTKVSNNETGDVVQEVNTPYMGLFGYLDQTAHITSRDINDSNKKTQGNIGQIGDNSRILGNYYVGGLVGYAKDASIENVTNNATITSSIATKDFENNKMGCGGVIGTIDNDTKGDYVFSNLINNGKITTSRNNVGGVVGVILSSNMANTKIQKCSNNGIIETTSDSIGGIAGRAIGEENSQVTIDGQLNKADSPTIVDNTALIIGHKYIGGIAGYIRDAIVVNSTNGGTIIAKDISGIEEVGEAVGGIAGYIEDSDVCEVINEGAVGAINENRKQGGIIGYAKGSGNITNLLNKNKLGVFDDKYIVNKNNNDTSRFVGYLEVGSQYKIYTGVDIASSTEGKNTVIYREGTKKVTAEDLNVDRYGQILINTTYLSNLSNLHTSVTYDGKTYVSYDQVFDQNLIWENVTSNRKNININYTINPKGTEPETKDGKYVIYNAGNLKYLSELNRKRFGIECTDKNIVFGNNISVDDHLPLGRNAYPWRTSIDGAKYTVTINSVDSSSLSMSLLGGVINSGASELIIKDIRLKYNSSITINKSSGLLLDSGTSIIISGIKILSNGGQLNINPSYGFDTFGTIAQNLYNSKVSELENYQDITINNVQKVGGLLGYMRNTLFDNCINESNISFGTTEVIGGLIGQAEGSLENGQLKFAITNSKCSNSEKNYAIKSYVDSGNASTVGGIVGLSNNYYYQKNIFGKNLEDGGKFCRRNGDLTAGTVGGIVAKSDSDLIVNCTTYGNYGNNSANVSGGIVGEVNGTGYKDNILSSVYNCTNYARVIGIYAGGIAGKAKEASFNINTNHKNGEILTDSASTGYSGGIVGYATDSQIDGCINQGYIASESFTTSVKVGGIAGESERGSLKNCTHNGYVGILAKTAPNKQAKADGYNILYFYNVLNVDNNNGGNYTTYKYEEEPHTVGDSGIKDNAYNLTYIAYSDSNTSMENNNCNVEDNNKFAVHDYFVTSGRYCTGWRLWWGGARIWADVYDYTGTLSDDGVTPFKLNDAYSEQKTPGDVNGDRKKNLEDGTQKIAYGACNFWGTINTNISVVMSFNAEPSSSFPANSDIKSYIIEFYDKTGKYPTTRKVYYDGDQITLPIMQTENSTLKVWTKDESGKREISSGEVISESNFTFTQSGNDLVCRIYAKWVDKEVMIVLDKNKDYIKNDEPDDPNTNPSIGTLFIKNNGSIDDFTFNDREDIKQQLMDTTYDKNCIYRVNPDGWYHVSISTWNYWVEWANKSTKGMSDDDEAKVKESRKMLDKYLGEDNYDRAGYADRDNKESFDNNHSRYDSTRVTTKTIFSITKETIKIDRKTEVEQTTDTYTIYPYWQRAYTVKFDLNNEKDEKPSDFDDQIIDEYSYVVKPKAIPTHRLTENEFGYWYYDDENVKFDFDNTKVTSNMTLTAKWKLREYNVKFIYGENLSLNKTLKVVHGSNVASANGYTELLSKVNIPGYTFKYWTEYGDQYNTNEPVEKDLTLKAYYEPIEYTVTFNNGTTASIKVKYNQYISVDSVPTTVKSAPVGYTTNVEYWYLDDEETAFDYENIPITGNITLNAKLIPDNVVITYHYVDMNNQAIIENVTDNSLLFGSIFKETHANEFIKDIDGYRFTGFYSDSNTPYDFEQEINSTKLDVYLKYIRTYNVTFIADSKYASDGVAVNKTIKVDKGGKIKDSDIPNNFIPTDKSYWLTDNNDPNTDISIDTINITSDITVYYYATYKVNIVYTIDESTGIFDTQYVEVGGSATKPTKDVEIISGYRFDNYYADESFTTLYDFDEKISTCDKKIYMKYIKLVTITYMSYDAGSSSYYTGDYTDTSDSEHKKLSMTIDIDTTIDDYEGKFIQFYANDGIKVTWYILEEDGSYTEITVDDGSSIEDKIKSMKISKDTTFVFKIESTGA
mgnify:CR=1 FL=1